VLHCFGRGDTQGETRGRGAARLPNNENKEWDKNKKDEQNFGFLG
jgi:hypothetical protein